MTDPDPHAPRYHSTGDSMRYHPLLNTLANVVTAVMAVAIVFRIY